MAYLVPPETLTSPREKPVISPPCHLLDDDCSFRNRRLIKKAVRFNLNLEKIKASPEGKKKKYLLNGLQKLVRQRIREPSNADDTTKTAAETSASHAGKQHYQLIPKEKRYETVKELGQVMAFEKQSPRSYKHQ